MQKVQRCKELKFFASGLRGKFLCYKQIETKVGPTRIYTFATPDGEVTIWENKALKEPLSKLKRDDEVVIIHNGTDTLENGHSFEDYSVYRMIE